MHRLTRTALVAIGVCYLVAAFAVPAFAWDLTKSTNGVVLSRDWSVDSTAVASIAIYYDYRGGDTWSMSHQPNVTSSYSKSLVIPALAGVYGDSIELDLVDGYRLQLVYITAGGVTRTFALVNEPMQVSVDGTPVVNITGSTTVTGTVAVSNPTSATTSVSIDGTVPVSVDSVGYWDRGSLGVAVALSTFTLGLIAFRGLSHA